MAAPPIERDFSSANLSRKEVHRILGFLGYGRSSAPIWFIGLEEGLSSDQPADFSHNLQARGAWDDVDGP
jgi:hypothetical protein